MIKTKRFIAGAVCPRCGELDRLVAYADDSGAYKECVSCGFYEQQLVQLEVNELETRVNHPPEQAPETGDSVQVINIVDRSSENERF